MLHKKSIFIFRNSIDIQIKSKRSCLGELFCASLSLVFYPLNSLSVMIMVSQSKINRSFFLQMAWFQSWNCHQAEMLQGKMPLKSSHFSRLSAQQKKGRNIIQIMKVIALLALVVVLASCDIRNLQIQGLGNSDGSVIIAFRYEAIAGWLAPTINFNITINGRTVHTWTVDGVNKGQDPRHKQQKFRMVFPVVEGANALKIGVGQGLSLTQVFVAQKACCGEGCVAEDANESGVEGDPEVFFQLPGDYLNADLIATITSGCLVSVEKVVHNIFTLTFDLLYWTKNAGATLKLNWNNGDPIFIDLAATSYPTVSHQTIENLEAVVGTNSLTLTLTRANSEAAAFIDNVVLSNGDWNIISNGNFGSTASWVLSELCSIGTYDAKRATITQNNVAPTTDWSGSERVLLIYVKAANKPVSTASQSIVLDSEYHLAP